MATFTSRLVLRMPDPTDLVSVTSDINANASIIDAAVGYQSVTAFPSAPYSGKSVMVSTDSYRSYFNNGTAPASAGWVEVLNSSGTFGSNIKLASGAQIVIGGDVNLFRNAANVLRTNDALIVDGASTLTGAVSASAGITIATGGLTVTAGGLTITAGTVSLPGGKIATKQSSQTTVANTTTETTVASFTIAANEVSVGSVYRIVAWGVGSVTGTPTIQFRTRIGGVAGTQMGTSGSRTASSGITNHPWRVEAYVYINATGVSGSWFCNMATIDSITQAGSAPITSTVFQDGTASNTRDTTISNDLVVTFQWGTANASNTMTCQGFSAQRVA